MKFLILLSVIGFLLVMGATISIYLFRRYDVSVKDIYVKGTSVYENLEEFVEADCVDNINKVTKIGLGLILIAITSALIGEIIDM